MAIVGGHQSGCQNLNYSQEDQTYRFILSIYITNCNNARVVIICILLAVVSNGSADSICDELLQAGSQKEIMKRVVELSFTMFSATESIAPYFDGRALDRNGNNVTNYFANNTMLKSLIESHVEYYGK